MTENNGRPVPLTVVAFLQPGCPNCRKQDRLLEVAARKHRVDRYDYWKSGVERALYRVDHHPTFIVELDGVEVFRTHNAEELL